MGKADAIKTQQNPQESFGFWLISSDLFYIIADQRQKTNTQN